MTTPAVNRFHPELPALPVPEATGRGLCLESTLCELPLYEFQVESTCSMSAVARLFDRHPTLPGVVILEHNQFLGMISRQRFLEFLIRPQGVELFMSQPLAVLYSYARTENLLLTETTPILAAAQMALRRSQLQQGEPIVVSSEPQPQRYRLLNVHDLNIAYWQIRGIETQVRYERTQAQMIQAEKMASLGRLVDGVAHEILDPVGFIWGNLVHVSTYTGQLMELLTAYEQQFPVPEAIADLQAEIELDYLREDLPQTITSIRAGAERLKKLVISLQNFCHIDDVYPKPANIHDCLDSILLLLKSRLSGEIEVVKNYGHLPPVTCYAGQLNQVFMNILTNAVDALLNQAVRQTLSTHFAPIDPSWQHPRPQITISTQVRPLPAQLDPETAVSRWVSIRIADNGPGLSAAQRQQILESFSVEKRAAKETSLAVSYRIVTAKHGGQLHLHSSAGSDLLPESDSGTEFEILLPLV